MNDIELTKKELKLQRREEKRKQKERNNKEIDIAEAKMDKLKESEKSLKKLVKELRQENNDLKKSLDDYDGIDATTINQEKKIKELSQEKDELVEENERIIELLKVARRDVDVLKKEIKIKRLNRKDISDIINIFRDNKNVNSITFNGDEVIVTKARDKNIIFKELGDFTDE